MIQVKDEISPDISIIVPVYNAAPFLDKCISSVLCQTFSSFELILINDGSTDESPDICSSACEKDARVRLISCPDRHGVSYARNKGIDSSAGEYLFFLDSDDCMHPQLLESMFQQAEKSQSDLVISERFRSDQTNEKAWTEYCDRPYKPEWTFWPENQIWDHWYHLLGRNAIWAKLFRKESIGNIRFNEKLSIVEDTLFNYCFLAERPCTLSYTSLPGYYYRIRNDSMSHAVSKENLLVGAQVKSGIRDRELSVGHRANAVILEDEKLVMMTNWLTDRKQEKEAAKEIKGILKKETGDPLYREVPVSRKFKVFLCLNFRPLFWISRKIKRLLLY